MKSSVNVNNFRRLLVPLCLCIASLIWIVTFSEFWTGKIALFPDGASYFNWTKYYFDNISRGVYPLWQPMDNWGYPVGFKIRFLGEFNPFLLLAYLPYQLGLNYYIAYFIYAIFYFLLGHFGFYLLAKRIFQDKFLACFSFVLLLFSNSGIAIFFNFCEVVLLVPGIWFFYFLITFHQQPSRFSFVGMTFTLMMILTTYMPFYFITILFSFLIIFSVLYIKQLKTIFLSYIEIIRKHKILSVLCVMAVILAAIPGYITYKETGSSEFSYTHRQADSAENAVSTGISMVNAGSIVGPLTIKGLFSGLSYQENYLSYFFLSVIIFPILLMSVFNPLNRRLVLYAGVFSLMLLITLTDATPVMAFLYKRIAYFRVTRNIFYLLYLVVPFGVLFVVEQLRIWKNHPQRNNNLNVAWIILAHLLFLVFLMRQGDIILTSYICLTASCILFTGYALTKMNMDRIFWILLITLSIVQPIEVYRHYINNVLPGRAVKYNQKQQRPVFFYERPMIGEVRPYAADVFKDRSGFIKKKFAGTSASAALQNNLNPQFLSRYTKYKFIIYDATKYLDPYKIPWPMVSTHLMNLKNTAFVDDLGGEKGISVASRVNAEAVNGEGRKFGVIKFDMNEIIFRTNFNKEKFVVYNDSFQSKWRAAINDKPVKLYRANVAFKGIWIPPGENVVKLRFGSVWLERFYFMLIFVFMGTLGGLIVFWMKDRNREEYA